MFSRLLTRFFWDSYDLIGRLIILSSLTTLPPALLFLLLLIGVSPLLIIFLLIDYVLLYLPLMTILLLQFADTISQDREPQLNQLFPQALKLLLPSILYHLLFWLIIALLLFNVHFYLRGTLFPPQLSFLTLIIAGICFWILLFWLLMSIFALPVLVKHKPGLTRSLKEAAVIVLAFPGFSIAALITLFVILLLCTISVAGILFLLPGLWATLINAAYETIDERVTRIRRQRQIEELPEKPRSWKEIREREQLTRKPRDRYSRTLRDLFKPWET